MRHLRFWCVGFVAALLTSTAPADDLLFPNSDFEAGTLEGWTVEGDAFRDQPTLGDNTKARNRESANQQGKYWIGGYEKYTGKLGKPGDIAGDNLTGTLTSLEFVLKHPYVTFRIGAGYLPGEVGVKLLVGKDVVELATGVDSETMELVSVDVKKFSGQTVRLQIFDKATGGWGHVNVDDFRGADKPAPQSSGEFAFTDNISAAAYRDVGYDQPHRPQFHFASRRNWLNDPNGMVFDGQRYHLFFQHNPKGTNWGFMTWGHATSPDMIHWTQHDHALLPYKIDRHAGTIFSGTAVIDHNNSLGKQVGDTRTICAFFTFAGKPKFYQAMAYSTDGGKSFIYWNEGRAVVPNQGFDSGERDPKVFWHEPSKQWVMALWVQSKPGRVRWFTSKNLTDWAMASDLMRDWAFECMDVLFLPVDGDVKQTRCVIYDASFDYEIGTFDGREFKSESPTLQASRGNFYAAQTFNQAPGGRAVQIGWMRGGPNSADKFGVPHNQQMSFPCDLTLRTTPAGVRLCCQPIPEISGLVTNTRSLRDIQLTNGANALAGAGTLDLVDLAIEFRPQSAAQIHLDLPRVSLRYDSAKQTLFHQGLDDQGNVREMVTLEKLAPRDGKVSLRFLLDRLTVEAFAFGGESFGAYYIDPTKGPKVNSIRAEAGSATVTSLEVKSLKSAWK